MSKGVKRVLNTHAFGVAMGAVTALWMIIVVVLVQTAGVGSGLIELYSGVIPGFSATAGGVISGVVIGFIEGYVIGWVLAWVYNRVAGK